MILWIDAQLSPQLASWITKTFGIEACATKELGLRDAKDREIYDAAREAGAAIMTKDSDFLTLLQAHGSPPQVLWITCPNTSNVVLKAILKDSLPAAMKLLQSGESIVEISVGRQRVV